MNINKKLVLIELNEINFDVVQKYLEGNDLPNWKKIFADGFIETGSEKEYDLLEPWIQWPSVHTGLTAKQHGLFRLGDVVGSKTPQIFELLESNGISVGCVSPMNAENNLKNAAYFIPDLGA